MGYLKKAFGGNLRFVRKSKKITQERLAEMVDIDIRQLARIEAGESFATAETIEKLSEKLEVAVNILFKIEKESYDDENKTLDAMETYNENLKKLEKKIKKIAHNVKKTEFVCLAIEALDKQLMLEKLKCTILGMELK